MKIDGYSYEILKSISPQKVRMYLLSSGWQLERRDPYSDVFSNPVTGEVVDVPDDKGFGDYAYRLEEIVRTISDSENKSIQKVVAGMTIAAASDTIEYHYEHKDNEVGLIPVNDMIKIVNSGKDLNNFAYRDFCDYKPAYPNSNWTGKKILDDIRLGPTLPGSYVVQFIYPLMNAGNTYGSTIYGEAILDNATLRDVCNKVEASLAAVVEAAECGKKEIDPELRISYNFVSSVRGFEFSDAEMEFRRTKIMDKKDEVRKPVLLSSGIFKRISYIEQNMRPKEMLDERDFVGILVGTADPREEKSDGPAKFKIRFIDVADGKVKTASLKLSGEEIDRAYDASKERKSISVSGKLVGAGNNKRIEDISEFKIIN